MFVLVLLALILIISLFYLYSAKNDVESQNNQLSDDLRHKRNENADLEKHIRSLQAKITDLEKELSGLLRTDTDFRNFDEKYNITIKEYYCNILIKDFDEKLKGNFSDVPYLASVIAELHTLNYEFCAQKLENKKHPAVAEAQRIRELKRETRAILEYQKILEYKLAYIQALFPNINDIFDSGFSEEISDDFLDDDNIDNVRRYISDEEYRSLSTSQRNQLALDNYLKRPKSKWQIGRDYEMYIGFVYHQKGYFVEYNGILKKLEDMGRDLIAKNNEETLIVQCKNWSQEKEIHEKHIFQLYGTVILYRLEHKKENVKGVFITSTKLSEKAKQIAEYLDIRVILDIPLRDFPRIKCNINRETGEKIYHLPFDQQYDNVVIEENKGEFFAKTVLEAEERGFRRAFKHQGRQ